MNGAKMKQAPQQRPKVLAVWALALGLACLGADPGAAATTLTTVPASPTTVDEITLHLRITDFFELRLDSVARVNNYSIQIHLTAACDLEECPSLDQEFDVPIGSLPRGSYVVDVIIDGGIWDWQFPLWVQTGVAAAPDHRFALAVAPEAPTDGAATQLVFTTESPACAPAALDGWSREGDTFVVRLEIPEPDAACLPPAEGTVLDGDSIDLGQLEPGAYRAELRDAADGSLLRGTPFTVADAGDAVTLLGRYRVAMTWKTADGQTGAARPVALGSSESALFSFFNLANWEVLVKVLDGCAINDHRWIFLAAATDVEFTLTVTDLEGGEPPYVHRSPAGLNLPLAETAAFSCAP
jgi:hypothetical protein